MGKSLKIGVISDTHIPSVTDKLPERVFAEFRGVDMILHAGDIVSQPVLDALGKLSAVYAVCGNMDHLDVCKELPDKRVIEAGKFKIGLTHGFGAPGGLIDWVGSRFVDDYVDAIVFGHSHHALNEVIDGILFFNPGTATDRRFSHDLTIGMLEVDDSGIKGRIIEI
jgi:putative phosphoesterase